jgi:glycosyltransferase involved in cell wall biosynthesis
MKPFVSVIIPTYNSAQFICDAVDSVLAQTYKNVEIIVVDDGSTDRTANFLKNYPNHLIYRYQANQGVSSARNLGVRMARGQRVAFLDSDDLWLPKKLETQVRFFSRNPEAVICQTEEIWIRNGRRVNPQNKHRKFPETSSSFLLLCLVSLGVMIEDLFNQRAVLMNHRPANYDLCRISSHSYLFIDLHGSQTGGHRISFRPPALDRYRIQAC